VGKRIKKKTNEKKRGEYEKETGYEEDKFNREYHCFVSHSYLRSKNHQSAKLTSLWYLESESAKR
jgi:hypothetical protein